ncbi:MAG: Non-canonical purine NTP pyrophosphatase [Microgenomates group bacterium GW2011_GWA2_44_7]|nr:MAG: Non-canonical purine NTP pyrophosphatase [Microgenomates group bacterium GW2011_GWA2_44_7]KKT77512.1 MAG: Non-canonical purine NTP pyrophosphatase [Microgenomates group bacterium GW2011_GWB1_44_8]KKW02814.1 MAG: Non-canonical purine NTP pyrophosphatase [Parcubacteria group bacterium GW2011_GWA1_49_11]
MVKVDVSAGFRKYGSSGCEVLSERSHDRLTRLWRRGSKDSNFLRTKLLICYNLVVGEIPELLYATNNPGKKVEVSRLLRCSGIKVVAPDELGIRLDVPEDGRTLEENAAKKVLAWMAVSGGRVVLADDTGIEIEALGGQAEK